MNEFSNRTGKNYTLQSDQKPRDFLGVKSYNRGKLLYTILLVFSLVVGILLVAFITFNKTVDKLAEKAEETQRLSGESHKRPISGEIDQSEGNFVPDHWDTYSNREFKFSLKYPESYSVEILSPVGTEYVELLVSKDKQNSFTVRANKSYQPADVIYYLDTTSSGEKIIGENTWHIYLLSNGYRDGGDEKSSPIFALQLEKNNILYSAVFYNQEAMEETQEKILSTFELFN